MYTTDEFQDMDDTKIKNTFEERRVTLRIQPYLNESFDGALQKVCLGVIDYTTFRTIVTSIAGYADDYAQKDAPDILGIDEKIDILRRANTKLFSKLGTIADTIIPPPDKDGDGKRKDKKSKKGSRYEYNSDEESEEEDPNNNNNKKKNKTKDDEGGEKTPEEEKAKKDSNKKRKADNDKTKKRGKKATTN
jgi:hypothetical protein